MQIWESKLKSRDVLSQRIAKIASTDAPAAHATTFRHTRHDAAKLTILFQLIADAGLVSPGQSVSEPLHHRAYQNQAVDFD